MDIIPKNPLLEFHPDTLQAVRKLYNLDQPGRMEEAINIIEEWVKKQEHFMKKDFSRDYLERIIIANKGLLERVKTRLDRTCTLRTLMPHFFEPYNLKHDKELHVISYAVLPKLTTDNYRVWFSKNTNSDFSDDFFFNYYKAAIILWEYFQRHDYSTGIITVLDYTEVDLLKLITKLDVTQMRQVTSLFTEGYGARVKGIHMITSSKVVETLITIFKQVFSAKIAGRIYIHANIESLHNIVPKDILPAEYGGKEKSLKEIQGKWIDKLSSDDHLEYMKMMNEAKTDETRRTVDIFNEQYMGTPGTFRTIVVD